MRFMPTVSSLSTLVASFLCTSLADFLILILPRLFFGLPIQNLHYLFKLLGRDCRAAVLLSCDVRKLYVVFFRHFVFVVKYPTRLHSLSDSNSINLKTLKTKNLLFRHAKILLIFVYSKLFKVNLQMSFPEQELEPAQSTIQGLVYVFIIIVITNVTASVSAPLSLGYDPQLSTMQ